MTDIDGLKKLRVEFPASSINKLPKPTKQQTEEVRRDFKKGIRCVECGGWHHPKVAHLDYVGHAALTSRFLDVDPLWSWEPLALDDNGLPAIDSEGLLWIKLTICGMTRIGVGDAGNKKGGDAMKERIGDALRNSGMRFGAALNLWHKGELIQTDSMDNKDYITPEPPKLEYYPDDKFEKNFDSWKSFIQSGKKSAHDLIAMVQSKGALTEDQKQAILNCEVLEGEAT